MNNISLSEAGIDICIIVWLTGDNLYFMFYKN